MGQHGDAVGREVHVRLQRVRADGHGALEGAHRVLREGGLVPAVGDGLGEQAVRAPPGGDRRGEGRWAEHVSLGRDSQLTSTTNLHSGQHRYLSASPPSSSPRGSPKEALFDPPWRFCPGQDNDGTATSFRLCMCRRRRRRRRRRIRLHPAVSNKSESRCTPASHASLSPSTLLIPMFPFAGKQRRDI